MHRPLVPMALAVLLLAACSKKPAPAVVPEPTREPTPTTTSGTPVQPAPARTDPNACAAAVAAAVGELSRMINFDTDQFDIRSADASILDAKAETLRLFPAVRVRITGHADERYTDEYNLVLGSRRSEAARDYLVRKGIDAGRLETASLGETAPLDPSHTEDAWARNRRAEFMILAGRETLASRVPGCQ